MAFLGFFDHICSSPDLQRLRSHVNNHCSVFVTSIAAPCATSNRFHFKSRKQQQQQAEGEKLRKREWSFAHAAIVSKCTIRGRIIRALVDSILRTSEVVVVASEMRRKFESVYTSGRMDTISGGEILQYWHCCGVADAFDPGCEVALHMLYDD